MNTSDCFTAAIGTAWATTAGATYFTAYRQPDPWMPHLPQAIDDDVMAIIATNAMLFTIQPQLGERMFLLR